MVPGPSVAPRRTCAREASSPPAPAARAFLRGSLASVYLHFRPLSRPFIPESGVDGKASRGKRLQMAKRLPLFGITDPRPLLPFHYPPPFSTSRPSAVFDFPTRMRGNASSSSSCCVFGRGRLLVLVSAFLQSSYERRLEDLKSARRISSKR